MIHHVISPQEEAVEEIAVIGLAGRFPGARDLNQFWQNLRDGVESIIQFTDQELEAQGIPLEWLNSPNYVKVGTRLEDFDKFDAMFFGYSPREAENIDPQQRIFLETAWEALENAGYNPETYQGSIGVFAGSGGNDYLNAIPSDSDVSDSAGGMERQIGKQLDFLCTRVSYKLNLKGPSLTVQTACSTSLVAVHLACQSLLNYQCSLALAGGVSIHPNSSKGYFYQEGMIFSPDGHCRAFDAEAHGTVPGTGVGIVVLKRLSEARSDGDTVHAVIKASAINNDGALKVSFTAPSVDAQAEVIAMTQALSNVPADTISYIETHGTGTSLGDPIEIAALTQAFRASTNKKGFCAIGSVKTNMGHADAAAGIAGLIKAILMLKHKQIPPSLHFKKPNPNIDFENSPFYVSTKLSEWQDNLFPRRAGVSSLGVGGTNVHAILEEAPPDEPSGKFRPRQLLLLSARTNGALERMATNLVGHLKNNPQHSLSDIAYTLSVGRKAFNCRRMVVCKDRDEAVRGLEAPDPGLALTSHQEPPNRDVLFMFSGQGSQYINMGLELYGTESEFQEQIDQCSKLLQPHLSLDVRNILYPEEKNVEEATQILKQTSITQPVLFTVEYALAKLWMSWGVRPAAMVGHSIGEYVAACLSGVFSFEDALLLVATRGHLMQQMPTGSMLAVQLSQEDVQPFLGQNVSLAAVNAPSYCVVSGEKEAINHLKSDLDKNDVVYTELHTSHAFHSKMMEPILDAFTEQLRQVELRPPQIPFVSNLTGLWITAEEAMSPAYWAKHLRQTVRFSDGVRELLRGPNRVFLEVGPGQTLSTFVRQHLDESKGRFVLSSLRHPKDKKSDIEFILNTLGRLWLSGIQVDWSGFYKNERRHRIPLPTYPFERQRYWVEAQQSTQAVVAGQKEFQKKSDIAEWFYLPSWKRSLAAKPLDGKGLKDQKFCWLLFVDKHGLGSELINQLKQQGQAVIGVQAGEKFGLIRQGIYTVNPQAMEDYIALIKELGTQGKFPQKIIHLWSITTNDSLPSGIKSFQEIQEVGFYSLLFLTQALANGHMTHAIDFEVITNDLHEVTGEGESLCPEKATILAACKVIPQEYANITCRNIDLGDSKSPGKQVEHLLGELSVPQAGSIVAYRGKHRWIQIFEPMKLNDSVGTRPRLREGGVYLITGGLGGVGMVLADFLAREVRAKLILTGRSGLPAREQWPQWLATHPEADVVSRKIRKVKNLEELGAEVFIVEADVANENQMREITAQAETRFGGINGVIHAAGVFVGTPLQKVSRDLCEQNFQPKVNGLFVLERVLEGRPIDFCLLTSSLSSVLGGIGYAGYAAANLFMDAFVQRHNQSHLVQWISVNFDGWQVQEERDQSEKARNELARLAIKPKEGQEVFRRILSWVPGNQIVVSTGDLQARVDKWIKLESLGELERAEKVELSPRYSRPNLSSEYDAPRNPVEQTIAEIWQALLKIEKVGIHDNFFELGGHSLMATQVISRIRQGLDVQIALKQIFESPTIAGLSMVIEEMFIKEIENARMKTQAL